MRDHSRLLSFAALIILLMATIPTSYSATTTVDFNPRHSMPLTGQSFIVNITVSDVTNLNCWQIALSFDPEILNCTELWIPTDNIFTGYSIFFPTPKIDKTIGRITAFCALEGTVGLSDSGKLCTIRFQSRDMGVSSLNFMNVMKMQIDGTYLLDPNGSIIPFQATVGIVEISALGFEQNLFDVTQNTETFHVIILTNSTVTNFHFNQTYKELSFNVTGPDGTAGASIATIHKFLLNDTILVLLDNIPIRTYTSILKTLPENATHCFTYFKYTHSTRNIKIRLTVPGDISGDRRVDVKDVAPVAKAFYSTPSSPNWNPLADLDHNYKVDVKDVAFAAKNYGKTLQI